MSVDSGSRLLRRQDALDRDSKLLASQPGSLEKGEEGSGSRSGTLTSKRNNIPRPSMPPPQPPPKSPDPETVPDLKVDAVDAAVAAVAAVAVVDVVRVEQIPCDDAAVSIDSEDRFKTKPEKVEEKEANNEDIIADEEDEDEFNMSLLSKTYDKEDEEKGEEDEEPKDSYENQLNEDIRRLEQVIAKHKEEQELEDKRITELTLAKQKTQDELERQAQEKLQLEEVSRPTEPKISSPRNTDSKPKELPPKPLLPKLKLNNDTPEKPTRPPVPKHKPPRPLSPPVRTTSLSKETTITTTTTTATSLSNKTPIDNESEKPSASDDVLATPTSQLMSSADYQTMNFKAGVTPPLKKFTPLTLVEFSDLDDSTVDQSDEDSSRISSPSLDINKYILGGGGGGGGSGDSKEDALDSIAEVVADELKVTNKPVVKPKKRPNRPSQPPRIALENPVPPPRTKSLSPDRPGKHRSLSPPLGVKSNVSDTIEKPTSPVVADVSPPVLSKPAKMSAMSPRSKPAVPPRLTSPAVRATSPPPRPTSPPVLPKPKLNISPRSSSLSTSTSVSSPVITPFPALSSPPPPAAAAGEDHHGDMYAKHEPQRLSSYESIAIAALGGEPERLDFEHNRTDPQTFSPYDTVTDLKPLLSAPFGSPPSNRDDEFRELSFTSTYEPPDFTFVSEEPVKEPMSEPVDGSSVRGSSIDDEKDRDVGAEVDYDKDEEDEAEDVNELNHSEEDVKLAEIDLMSDFMSEFEKRFSTSGNESNALNAEDETVAEDTVFDATNKDYVEEEPEQNERALNEDSSDFERPKTSAAQFNAWYDGNVDFDAEEKPSEETMSSYPPMQNRSLEEESPSPNINQLGAPPTNDDDLKMDPYEPLSRIVEEGNEASGDEVEEIAQESVENVQSKLYASDSEVISEPPRLPDSEPPPIPSCPPPMEEEEEEEEEGEDESVSDVLDLPQDEVKGAVKVNEEANESLKYEVVDEVLKEVQEDVTEPHMVPLAMMSPKPFLLKPTESSAKVESTLELRTDPSSNSSTNPVIAPSTSLQKYMIPGRRHSLEQTEDRKHYRPVTNRFSALATSKFPWKQEYRANVKAPESQEKEESKAEEEEEEDGCEDDTMVEVMHVDTLSDGEQKKRTADPAEAITPSEELATTASSNQLHVGASTSEEPATTTSSEQPQTTASSEQPQTTTFSEHPNTAAELENIASSAAPATFPSYKATMPQASPSYAATTSPTPSSEQSPLRFFTPTAFVAKKPASDASPKPEAEGSEGNNNDLQKHNVLIKRPSFDGAKPAETDAESPGAHGYRRVSVNTQQWAYTPIGYGGGGGTQNRSPPTDSQPQDPNARVSDV